MGNLTSVKNAIKYLNLPVNVEDNPKEISKYEKLIFPGVGAFGEAMKNLRESGMDQAILEAAEKGVKIIGICLGMQLLFTKSYEFGENYGLNLISGEVHPFEDKVRLSVPHMGWNNVHSKFDNWREHEADYYFVHSYYCIPFYDDEVLFTSEYGIQFCSAVMKDNVWGFQFHPEKSQKAGIHLLRKVLLNA